MAYRYADPNIINRQIGLMTQGALGVRQRYAITEEHDGRTETVGLLLKLTHGRFIEIRLQADDLYEVLIKRQILRGARRFEVDLVAGFYDIYADQLADILDFRDVEALYARKAAA